MPTICPTVTAENPHVFRTQIERAELFTERVHVDLSDGIFTPNKLIGPNEIWWPEEMFADIHLMYRDPLPAVKKLLRFHPSLVIVHAEASGNFIEVADLLKSEKIRVGLALLPQTEPDIIKSAIDYIDHVLIFDGNLGSFGGTADLNMTKKIPQLKTLKPSLEIGWDGGINDTNAQKLAQSGVDILNVGGYIQRSDKPKAAYARLVSLVDGS